MAITHYYVRPVNGANVAGQGTSHATAYLTHQFASDDIGGTHGQGADGDQINICDEGPSVAAAPWNLAGYGAPALGRPLIIRGYTTVANDGGIGEIDCNGATMWASNAYDDIALIDLEIHSPGNNNCIDLDNDISIIHCYVHPGVSAPNAKYAITADLSCLISHCYIPAFGTNSINIYFSGAHYAIVENNYVITDNIAIQESGFSPNIRGNVIYCTGNSTGIISTNNYCYVTRNAVFAQVGNTGAGISGGGGSGQLVSITNNIVANFSGVGGAGIDFLATLQGSIVGNNAFYNCTNNYATVDDILYDLRANDVALGADPFVNAAAGNFMLTAAAQTALRSLGWPSTYLGAAVTDIQLTIGPVQYGETTAGGGRRPRIRWHGV